MNYYRILLLCTCCLCFHNSYAQIYKWVDDNGRTQFSDKPHPSAQKPQIKRISSNLKTTTVKIKTDHAVTKNIQKPNHDSIIIKLRKLLQQKKFKELNKLLEQLNSSYQSNALEEDALFAAYEAFDIKNKEFIPLFDSWVATTPNVFHSYLARAKYYYHLGWFARGSKWAGETKEKQFKEMSSYFKKSADDIILALNIDNQSIVSYHVLLGITRTIGQVGESEGIMRKALEVDPASFNIRSQHLKTLTPRWGGSVEKMQAFIEEASKYEQQNPKLKLLEGFISAEAGDMQAVVKKYNIANTLYTKSLESGEYHDTLFKRGKNNTRRGNYQDAITDLNRAIALNSEKPLYYYWRAATYIDLQKYNEALNDIQYAYKLDPYDNDILDKRKWLSAIFENQGYELRQSQNITPSVEKYSSALSLNSNNAAMYYGRARSYIEQHKLDLALIDIKKAIEIKPNDINNYLLIDYILAKSKDWDQIIKYWDDFIKLNPNNGRGYVERGGAYYHKGDIQTAVANAKISADLGNLEGKEAYGKFKHMIK